MRKLLAGVVLVAASCGGNEPGLDPDAATNDAITGDGPSDAAVDGAIDGAIDAPIPFTTINLTLIDRPLDVGAFTFLVLYQDGSGPWTHAPAPVGDLYSFPVISPSYAVAWTCIAGPQNTVNVAAFTTAERTNLTMEIPARCTDRITRVALSGVISNRGNAGTLSVHYGDRTSAVDGLTGAYALDVRPGTNDLFVVRRQFTTISSDVVAERVAVQRGVTVSAATTANVNFATAENAQPFPVTIAATMGTRAQTTTRLHTATTTDPVLVRDTNPLYVTRSLAASQMVSTDVYDQAIIVSTNAGTAMTTAASTNPGALTYVAPPPFGTATSTIAAVTPYPLVRTTWAAYANAIGYRWEASQNLPNASCGGTTGCALQWTALVSPAIAGASPAYQIPDLSTIVGWSSSFQPVTGRPITGFTQAMTSTAGALDFPDAAPAAGTKRTFARSDWAVTP